MTADTRRRVLITYDLAEDPGLFDEFKEEMESRKWQFWQGGQDLPNTTCFAFFVPGVSLEDAKNTAHTDLGDSQAAVRKKHNRRFKITCWAFAVAEEGDMISSGTFIP